MSALAVAASTGQGVAIIAALVGLGCLLLGRRSAPREVLTTLTVVVALSGALAGAQLVELRPTHASLSDTESTHPQTVVRPADDPENVSDAEPGELATKPTGGSVDATRNADAGAGDDKQSTVGTNVGRASHASPDPGEAVTPQGHAPSPPADPSAQPAPSLPLERPSTDSAPGTGN